MAELYSTTFVSTRITTPIMVTSMDFSVNSTDLEAPVTRKPLPIDMQFNDGHKLAIVMYSLLMTTSAIGNISVLSAVFR